MRISGIEEVVRQQAETAVQAMLVKRAYRTTILGAVGSSAMLPPAGYYDNGGNWVRYQRVDDEIGAHPIAP